MTEEDRQSGYTGHLLAYRPADRGAAYSAGASPTRSGIAEVGQNLDRDLSRLLLHSRQGAVTMAVVERAVNGGSYTRSAGTSDALLASPRQCRRNHLAGEHTDHLHGWLLEVLFAAVAVVAARSTPHRQTSEADESAVSPTRSSRWKGPRPSHRAKLRRRAWIPLRQARENSSASVTKSS